MFSAKKSVVALALSSLAAISACGPASPGSSDADNDGLSPMVDEQATGWVRIRSIPKKSPSASFTSMALTDVTLIDGSFHLMTQEQRQSQGGTLGDRFAISFSAAAPAKLESHTFLIKEAYDVYQSGGLTSEYRYVFKPGTAEIVQSYRETQSGGGFADTHSGIRGEDNVTNKDIGGPGGGHFAGLADIYADGTAVLPGTELYSAYYRDGAWNRLYGRYSDLAEPYTDGESGYPVQLADGKIFWAMLQRDRPAIGGIVPRPNVPGEQQVKTLVLGEPQANYQPGTCYARAFGNQVVFLNVRVDNGTTTISAHRWTEDATTIETLYTDVKIPPTYPLPKVTNNEPHRLLIDVNGGLTFLTDRQENGEPLGAQVVRVDAEGPHPDPHVIPNGPWLVQGPWLLDGSLYAGIGATDGRDVPQLDLVKLK